MNSAATKTIFAHSRGEMLTPAITAPTRLVQQMNLPNTSYITNEFDGLARLTKTSLKQSGGTTTNSHAYVYNNAFQRTKQTFTDSGYIDYTYDDASELLSGKTYTSGGSPVTTQTYGYRYDPAWNMIARTNNVTVSSYTVNSLNQITADPNYSYGYDRNGNRTNRADAFASRTFNYDDENQLTVMHTDTSYTPDSSRWKSELIYDGKMRLRVRKEYIWPGGGSNWSLSSETRYVYDGMLVVQERNSGNTPTVTYTRGNDLSETLQGAGGIGGLLARSHGYSTTTGNWSTHNYYHSDGNGNVTFLINSSQTIAASYKYNPYGGLITSSGTLASANTMRFSSKEFHNSSGLYYYGYRWYDPNVQRWVNQDPIQEDGGINLYCFVANQPVNLIDSDGLDIWRIDFPGLHDGIVGSDPDGGYWYADFGPAGNKTPVGRGKYGFTPWAFPPEQHPSVTIVCKVKTTPEIDRALRDAARRRSEGPHPTYYCIGRNCWGYAAGIIDEATRRAYPYTPPPWVIPPSKPYFPPR